MWEGIDKDQKNYNDLTWIVDGIQQNTLLWVKIGSYDRERSVELSGVGWVIMCTKTQAPSGNGPWQQTPTKLNY